jgi:hypothetical protein
MILPVILALVVGAMAGTALAKGGVKSTTYNFKGTLVSESGTTAVVGITQGNGAARKFVGQQLTFTVASSTRVDRDDVPVSLSSLVGEEVRIQSKAPGNTTNNFPARRISAESGEDNGGTTSGGGHHGRDD